MQNIVAYCYSLIFNIAGKSLKNKLYKTSTNNNYIIPTLINSALTGESLTIFGNDYNTPDKTAIRDYVHVLDVAKAFILACKYIETQKGCAVYNIATGTPTSIKQLCAFVEKYTNKNIKLSFEAKRIGDSAIRVADITKIKTELGWKPLYSDIGNIVESEITNHYVN